MANSKSRKMQKVLDSIISMRQLQQILKQGRVCDARYVASFRIFCQVYRWIWAVLQSHSWNAFPVKSSEMQIVLHSMWMHERGIVISSWRNSHFACCQASSTGCRGWQHTRKCLFISHVPTLPFKSLCNDCFFFQKHFRILRHLSNVE